MNNAPMDVAMKMVRAATPIMAEIAGATIFERMERNEIRKRRRRSESPADRSNLICRMERTIRQQTQEITQLHQTVGHLANMVETWAARKVVHRLAMMTWMQQREQKWDTRIEDNPLLGARITIMIVQTMKGVAQGQEARETESKMTARTDGGGLESSKHACTMREEGPEERQQQQPQPKPKSKRQLKPPPEPQPAPKPDLAPTPSTSWETAPP
jgi:hypothetical protein